MWVYMNPNPCRQEEPDCVVRAIAIATGRTWDEVHYELCEMSREKCTMPSVNWLWGECLAECGFEKHMAPDGVTVRRFAERHPDGTYVLCTGTHAVAACRGNYLDAWDSGDEMVTYYFRKKELKHA